MKTGDVIVTEARRAEQQPAVETKAVKAAEPGEPEEEPEPSPESPLETAGTESDQEDTAVHQAEMAPLEEIAPKGITWHFTLNDKPVTFPAKPDNAPYLLLDMLQHSGLDFDNLTSPVVLAVNGLPGIFQQELRQNDSIIIKQDE